MANLKVVVPLLNKRKFPVIDTADKNNVVGQVKKDFQFESIAEVTNALGNWYQDRDGYYYWGGGVAESTKAIQTSPFIFDSSKIAPWCKLNFDVSRFWQQTTGKNITVAVIDTGIFPHLDLKDAIDTNHQKSFISDSVMDTDGHGTHVSGIIAARGLSNILGVAPEAMILPIKVAENNAPIVNGDLVKAIEYATSLPHVGIINLSLIAEDTDKFGIALLRKAIQKSISAGKIVIAATGNNSGSFIGSPSDFDNVIAVSSVGLNSKAVTEMYYIPQTANISDRVNTCCPGVEIISCANTQSGVKSLSGTSMAAAYMSGLVALKMQMLKNNPIIDSSLILGATISSVFQTVSRDEINIRILDSNKFINQ